MSKTEILLIFLVCISSLFKQLQCALFYPAGSGMGLFFALAVPVDIPRQNVFVAYNFEANYMLPSNETQFQIEVIEDDAINENEVARKYSRKVPDRKLAYQVIENKMETFGYPGRSCLLRLICEAAGSNIEHNGVLGEIIHIILTPSTSTESDFPEEYNKAEKDGIDGDCSSYDKNCKTNFMDLFTWLGI